MTTQETRRKGQVLENSILNGSANLNYNYYQFQTLSIVEQKNFLWYALVQLDLTGLVCYSELDNVENFKKVFDIVQANKGKKRNERKMQVGNVEVNTSAQLMVLTGYGDSMSGKSADMQFRNLNFKAECESYQDFKRCIELIKEYNEFDSDLILKHAEKILGLQSFYGESNPNNGKSHFKFEVGREGSPVFYVKFSNYYNNNIIAQRDGGLVKWQEYTGEDFKFHMQVISNRIKADEFEIEEQDLSSTGYKYYTARFWFD